MSYMMRLREFQILAFFSHWFKFHQTSLSTSLEFQAYQNCVMANVQGYVMENGLEGKATPEHAEEWEGCVAYARKYAQK